MLPTQQSVYLTGKGVQVSREKEGAGSTGRMHGGEGCSVPGCSHAMWALSSCRDRAAPSGSEQACVLSPLALPSRDKALTCQVCPEAPRWGTGSTSGCTPAGPAGETSSDSCWGQGHLQRTKGQCAPGSGRRPRRINAYFVFHDPIGTVKVSPHSAWTNLENHILGTHPFSGTLKWVREQQVRAALGFTWSISFSLPWMAVLNHIPCRHRRAF